MDISKSSRHSKITGDLGEYLTLYWLSKHGFQCVRVDHSGIDIIAHQEGRTKNLGISVKSRSRTSKTEESSILIPSSHFEHVKRACADFDCCPYFALFVDRTDKFVMVIAPMDKLYAQLKHNKTVNWKMDRKSIAAYHEDPQMAAFEVHHAKATWRGLEINC